MMNQTSFEKTILDLCGGTGSWSRPYAAAGYNVIKITLPENDVRWFRVPDYQVYGVLAAPPVTIFQCLGRNTGRRKMRTEGH